MFNNAALIQETERLNKFAWRLTNNVHDAEDLVQSALLRAIEKKHMFKEGTNLYSWVSKIMFNMFVSKYRRKVKFESQYDPEPYLEKQSVKAQQDIEMEVQDVEKAMQTLSEDHKDILIMVCVENMQYAEVAEKLNIPVGTVRSRLSRARDSLEQAMTQPKVDAFMTPAPEMAARMAA
ncbi:MAG TPA: sigma-70 family RNA polymerase sigma factor [Micavibrio sp.]|nr:sigma-70 family RNA polymerase sigma factor [Pseudomonadota bacterium]HIF25190.1 sigma-70 family RNA polymerase sigma factor [Micavibrio sp.]